MFTSNKTHTMILVSAADDFRKYRKNADIEICFNKVIKKSLISKISIVWWFSSWLNMNLNLIETAL